MKLRNEKQNCWKNVYELEIQNLSLLKHLIFSPGNFPLPALSILPKLYDTCKYCCRNPVETFE